MKPRQPGRIGVSLAAGLLLAAWSWTGVAATAQEKTVPPFVSRMEYWVRDGGEWRCANPDYKPGTEQAKEFGYKFTWALHRQVVVLEIFGEFDGGRGRITFWHNTSAWHPGEKRIVMTHLGVGGAVLHGYELMPDENTREHVFSGVAADGSEFKFRDVVRITGPDTHESTSYEWKDGQWVEQRKMLWRRVKAG